MAIRPMAGCAMRNSYDSGSTASIHFPEGTFSKRWIAPAGQRISTDLAAGPAPSPMIEALVAGREIAGRGVNGWY